MDDISRPVACGDLRALMRISMPLMLFLFCESLSSFCERIFLSYHSTNAVYGSLNASYLATIFQSPCIAISAMAQVFVGFYYGGRNQHQIGPCVWQLIWFSLLSLLITLPLSFLGASWYFKDAAIREAGLDYFMILAFGNFLFPLNTALSSFYVGRGRTILVSTLMLSSYAVHLGLSWLLIFGAPPFLPALGPKGAALAKCLSLGLLSVVFFSFFLNKKNRILYRTHLWQFSPRALWHYMRPGMARAFGYLSSKVCWVTTSYIIISKGGAYLDVLTVGGTVITFLVFITAGIYRATLTIASNLIGAGKIVEIKTLCRSFTLYALGIAALLTIPLLFYPHSLIYFFSDSAQEIFLRTFKSINHWILIYILALTVQSSFCALLVTLKDLKIQLYCSIFISPIPIFLAYFGLGRWSADKLWAIMIFENMALLLFFFIRLKKRQDGNLSRKESQTDRPPQLIDSTI